MVYAVIEADRERTQTQRLSLKPFVNLLNKKWTRYISAKKTFYSGTNNLFTAIQVNALNLNTGVGLNNS